MGDKLAQALQYDKQQSTDKRVNDSYVSDSDAPLHPKNAQKSPTSSFSDELQYRSEYADSAKSKRKVGKRKRGRKRRSK